MPVARERRKRGFDWQASSECIDVLLACLTNSSDEKALCCTDLIPGAIVGCVLS